MIKNNIGLKIISVLISLVIWFVVSNIDNPIISVNLNVPVKKTNEDVLSENNYQLISSQKDTVEIVVKGRKKAVEKVSKDDFEITLDFSQITEENQKVKLSKIAYKGSQNITWDYKSANEIEVNIEKIKTVEVPIKVELTGMPDANYEIISYSQKPEVQVISDIESVISHIDSIEAVINIDGLDQNKTYRKQCTIYDSENNEYKGLSNEIVVDVEVSVAKTVPIILEIAGQPGFDCYVNDTDYSPEYVKITGPGDMLKSINVLKTVPISVENIEEDINTDYAIKLPEGIRLVNSPEDINTSIDIEKLIYKELVFTPYNVNFTGTMLPNPFTYEILNESIKVEVKGKEVDIQNLKNKDIKLQLPVTGIEEGVSEVEITAVLPENIEFVSADIAVLDIYYLVQFEINSKNINIINKNDNEYEYETAGISTVIIRGPSDKIKNLKIENISPAIDANGLNAGEYSLTPNLALPEEVEILNISNINLNVTAKKSEQDQTSTSETEGG